MVQSALKWNMLSHLYSTVPKHWISNLQKKKSTIEIELTLNSCIENVFLLIVFHLTIIDDSPAKTVACTLALPQLKRISSDGIEHRQKTALLICVTIHFWIQLCDWQFKWLMRRKLQIMTAICFCSNWKRYFDGTKWKWNMLNDFVLKMTIVLYFCNVA